MRNAAQPDVLRLVSYHAVYDDSIMDALRFAETTGFAGIQVAAELTRLAPDRLSEAALEEIASFCAETKLTVSVHGPDYSVSMFETSRHFLGAMWDYLSALFDACYRMGSRIVTLHFGQMPTFGTATMPRIMVPPQDEAVLRIALRENLRRTVDLAAGRFTLCMENFGLNEVAREAVEPLLKSRELSLCWDLPKSYNDPQLEQFLWANLRFVHQVHLHDMLNGRSHQVLGAGSLDMHRYFPKLATANVQNYCIEVRPREKAVESLRYLEHFLKSLS